MRIASILIRYGWHGAYGLWAMLIAQKRIQDEEDLFKAMTLQVMMDIAKPNYREYERVGWLDAVKELRQLRHDAPKQSDDKRTADEIINDIAERLK